MKEYYLIERGNVKAKWRKTTERRVREILTGNWIDVELALQTLKEYSERDSAFRVSCFTLGYYGENPPDIYHQGGK